MTLRLPDEKVHQVREELALFQKRMHASKKQFKSLAGKLNFCSSVVYDGRVYSRRIIDTFSALKGSYHKAKLNDDIRTVIYLMVAVFHADFQWTVHAFGQVANNFIFTDSCKLAAGGFYDGDWFYFNLDVDWPQISNMHINVKETMAVYLAVYRLAPLWRNKRIIFQSDRKYRSSNQTRYISKSFLMSALRNLFWLSVPYNFHITSKYICGISNTVADAASRIHEPNKLALLLSYTIPSHLQFHMTHTALCIFKAFG